MADKSYRSMTDAELRTALAEWENHVETAAGWTSAHFSAKQVAAICGEGNRRGLGFRNRFPITFG